MTTFPGTLPAPSPAARVDRRRRPRRDPRRRPRRRPALSARGHARHRQDDVRPALPPRRRRPRRAGPLHHPLGDGGRAARGRRLAWLVARRHRRVRARSTRRACDPTPSSRSCYPVGGRARRDRSQRSSAQIERLQPTRRRLRQPVRDAPAGAGPAALPAPDARPQAVLRRAAPAPCCCSTTRPREPGDLQLHSICPRRHQPRADASQEYGTERRRLRVVKMRGQKFQGGKHDFVLDTGRAAPSSRAWWRREHQRRVRPRAASSTGNARARPMLGGGLVRGTSTLLIGPVRRRQDHDGRAAACTRRSSAASSATYFLFDEGLSTLLLRSRQLGMDIEPYIESGQCRLEQIDPAELSPGEFASLVRQRGRASDGAAFVVHRQPQRLPAGDARAELPAAAHARAADLPQPPGRHHGADRRPARRCVGDVRTDDRHQLPQRRDRSLFRFFEAEGARALGGDGDEEPHRPERAHDPRVPPERRRRPAGRRAARRTSKACCPACRPTRGATAHAGRRRQE